MQRAALRAMLLAAGVAPLTHGGAVGTKDAAGMQGEGAARAGAGARGAAPARPPAARLTIREMLADKALGVPMSAVVVHGQAGQLGDKRKPASAAVPAAAAGADPPDASKVCVCACARASLSLSLSLSLSPPLSSCLCLSLSLCLWVCVDC